MALDPLPDGGYPNDNTAEGDGTLANLDTYRINCKSLPKKLNDVTTGANVKVSATGYIGK